MSIGYACFPRDAQDSASLLSVADHRMYQTKTDRKLGILANRDRQEPVADATHVRLRMAA